MDLTGRAQSTVARPEAMPEADADTVHTARTHGFIMNMTHERGSLIYPLVLFGFIQCESNRYGPRVTVYFTMTAKKRARANTNRLVV